MTGSEMWVVAYNEIQQSTLSNSLTLNAGHTHLDKIFWQRTRKTKFQVASRWYSFQLEAGRVPSNPTVYSSQS